MLLLLILARPSTEILACDSVGRVEVIKVLYNRLVNLLVKIDIGGLHRIVYWQNDFEANKTFLVVHLDW